ncbi:hypothetical protein CDA63_11745 [Hymenobacter amundsenii]|uniref:Uncharacterized protein n=1 Tax=Hymenobacter amundsenii TaxID=2006685 RepID=A0A246FJX6_9BACT|nr:DUF6712 family protein [Hymenobacter amundsenii]OWP62884.1 hypothetical protein CDA63_11745 [Hymenobacter amundsenii]
MSLLKTADELRRYVTVDSTTVPEPVHREEEHLRTHLLLPVLGATLLHWLDDQYDAGTVAPTDDTLAGKLLARVQAPLGRLAVAGSLDELQVSIDQTGIHIVSTDTQKTAFGWQIAALRKTLTRKGYQDMNALLAWLEANRAASPELEAWAAGEGQVYRRQLLVSAEQFSQYENISASWTVFAALVPLIRKQELFVLEPQIGYDFLSELRDQVRTRTLSEENRDLLTQFVEPALAACTLARAVPELGLRLTGDGIELAVARIDTDNSKEADAGLDQLLRARAFDAQHSADILLEKMRRFLNERASATRYATYFRLGPYRAPNAAVVPLNTPESKVYRLS